MRLSTESHSIIRKFLSGGTCLLLLCTWQSASHLFGASSNERRTNRLEDGQLELAKPVERQLASGETHSYWVILSEGQFLSVIIEEQEIESEVGLFGPDGKLITGIVSYHRKNPLQAVTDSNGKFRIEVRAREKETAGKYVIKIDQLRVATPQDRKWWVAHLSLVTGKKLEATGTGEAFRDALKRYEETLPLMQDAGDREGEAFTLERIGGMYKLLGQHRKALEHYEGALAIVQGMGQGEEAYILNNMAIAYNNLGERQKALECYNRSLALIDATDDWRAKSSLLSNMGGVYLKLGKSQMALEHFQAALQLTEAKGSQHPAALNNIAEVYSSHGEMQKALEYFTLASSQFRSTGNRYGEHVTLTNIGMTYHRMGELQRALEYYDLALPHVESTGNRRGEAIVLNGIGFVYNSLGNSRKALDYLYKALSLIQAVGDRLTEATTLINIGSAYDSLGEKEKALGYYRNSLLASRAIKAPDIEALALYRVTLTLYSMNNLVEARTNIEAALEIIESLRTNIASSGLRASYFASSQKHYDLYINLLMRLDHLNPKQGLDAMALHASERTRARTLLEMLAEARVDLHRDVEPSLLERERLLKQLLDAKIEKQVKLLSGKHTQQEAELLDKEAKELVAKYNEVKAQIKLKSPAYAALTQPRPLTLKEIQREVVDTDTLLLEYWLGEEQSYLWAVTKDSMLTFRLPKRAEIEEAAQLVYDYLSVGQQNGATQLDRSHTMAASALSQIVLGPVAAYLGNKRLIIVPHGALSYIPFPALPLPAVERQAASNKRPVAHSTAEPLIARHEIIYLPSASTLAVLRKQLAGRKRPSKAVAIIADPVFSKNDVRVRAALKKGGAKSRDEEGGERKDEPINRSHNLSQIALQRSTKESGLNDARELPRLPFSREEAKAIFNLGQPAGAMSALGFNASREIAASAEIGQYRIVHFATHSLLNNEHPELSGLVLSLVDRQGQPQNGFLRLYDIYNLKLEADLVVLSACQTALGKHIKGEGLVGVTRGFMYAGAASVMASLWKVDDEATAELMKVFYKGMIKEKQTPTAALRAAQLWMEKQKRWRSPYYWAGFILQGEWR